MIASPIHPGVVDWTGENPGIYLKEIQDGPWVSLATFFRITYSPHGRGHGVLLLQRPDDEVSIPEAANICISDNEPMARFLVDEFFSKFASFKVSPGLARYYLVAAYRGPTRGRYALGVFGGGQCRGIRGTYELEAARRAVRGGYAAGYGADRSPRDVQPVPGFTGSFDRAQWRNAAGQGRGEGLR